MGFLQAVYDFGILAAQTGGNSGGDSRSSFLQWPSPIIEDENRSSREIRVWLNVEDMTASTLKVLSIEKLNIAEYPKAPKEGYLFREPVGAAAAWRFSPVYKLGKGVADGKRELAGLGSDESLVELKEWLLGQRESFSSKMILKEIKENRLFKLKNSMLNDFEKEAALSQGSVNIIMQYFLDHIDDFADLWSEKKRSYLFVFGVNDNGKFLYPGEIHAFDQYFSKKIEGLMGSGKTSKPAGPMRCANCEREDGAIVSIDKLFAFSTFDKPGFLPGAKETAFSKEKVFPICADCFSVLCDGKEKIKSDFRDSETIPGLYIDVLPELIMGVGRLKNVGKETGKFLRQGIKREEKRFNRLADQGEGLVYHFFFWEQNQRQERIHLLVEDVPPTRLKKLETDWQQAVKAFLPSFDGSLDSLLKVSYGLMMSLGGKTDEDKKVMRTTWINLMGNLLSGKRTDSRWFKTLIVSRLSGLFADSDWAKKYARTETKKWHAMVRFLETTNREVII